MALARKECRVEHPTYRKRIFKGGWPMAIDLAARYGKTALVTGASAGIGRAFARELSSRGMDVIVVARRAERLDELRRELEAARPGARVFPIVQDLAAPDAAEAIERRLAELGLSVDFLVNNAGFGQWGEFSGYDRRRDLDMVAVNCRAVVDLTHRLLPAMKARRRGAVIVVSSVLGVVPAPFMATYSATKAFDKFFAESIWPELRPHGVDVLCVQPMLTETEFSAGSGMTHPPIRVRTSEQVVATALAALGRRATATDGWLHGRLAMAALRAMPRAWYYAIYQMARRPRPGAGAGGS
jgi:short-subunit dehydrogenase